MSPWGNRGAILEKFSWSYDYLLWGINWLSVQLMLADGAKINDQDAEANNSINLENKQDIINYFNSKQECQRT